MDSNQKFIRDIKKATCKRKTTINNSYGVRDYYKYYRQLIGDNKDLFITELQYFKILRYFNRLLAQQLINSSSIVFPYMMGEIELRKVNSNVSFKDGKLKTNLSINWGETLKLWSRDQEAYTNKILVRNTNKEIFRIIYNKSNAQYINKSYYKFIVNRQLKHQISENIKEGKIDAYTFI